MLFAYDKRIIQFVTKWVGEGNKEFHSAPAPAHKYHKLFKTLLSKPINTNGHHVSIQEQRTEKTEYLYFS